MVHYTQTWLPLLSFALIAAVVYLLSSFIAGGAEFLPHITKAATGLPLASASMTLNHDNESHSGAAGPTFFEKRPGRVRPSDSSIFRIAVGHGDGNSTPSSLSRPGAAEKIPHPTAQR